MERLRPKWLFSNETFREAGYQDKKGFQEDVKKGTIES